MNLTYTIIDTTISINMYEIKDLQIILAPCTFFIGNLHSLKDIPIILIPSAYSIWTENRV